MRKYGEIFETEWDDPLLIEESWTVENSKGDMS